MGVPTRTWLLPGEQIIYWARQSPRQALFLALLSGGIAAGVPFALRGGTEDLSVSAALVAAVLYGLIAGLPHVPTLYQRFELVLTSHRLLYRKGLLVRKTGEIAIADIAEIKGPKSGDAPFEVKMTDGKSLGIAGLPDLGRLRDTIAKAAGSA